MSYGHWVTLHPPADVFFVLPTISCPAQGSKTQGYMSSGWLHIDSRRPHCWSFCSGLKSPNYTFWLWLTYSIPSWLSWVSDVLRILSETRMVYHQPAGLSANGSTAEKPQSQEMLESSDKWWLKTFTICSPQKPQVRLILTDASRKQ